MEDFQSFSTSDAIMEDIYLEYIWKKKPTTIKNKVTEN